MAPEMNECNHAAKSGIVCRKRFEVCRPFVNCRNGVAPLFHCYVQRTVEKAEVVMLAELNFSIKARRVRGHLELSSHYVEKRTPLITIIAITHALRNFQGRFHNVWLRRLSANASLADNNVGGGRANEPSPISDSRWTLTDDGNRKRARSEG
ncbi:hypothetical protein M514_07372 [Trichuris suis]|uniref:Uncharacterized protein n=1 Tax=Trichuris suis TaxID=68888 RepID=A0A085NC65_9BILA|nr:hypothetical protein M514_07372 [Trichuris suis]